MAPKRTVVPQIESRNSSANSGSEVTVDKGRSTFIKKGTIGISHINFKF